MTTYNVSSVMIERPAAYGNTTDYGIGKILIPNVPNVAGSGAGATVTVSIAVSEENLPSDGSYAVHVTTSQACAVYWANKTASGFDVILKPLTTGATLAAGTFDCTVTWQRG